MSAELELIEEIPIISSSEPEPETELEAELEAEPEPEPETSISFSSEPEQIVLDDIPEITIDAPETDNSLISDTGDVSGTGSDMATDTATDTALPSDTIAPAGQIMDGQTGADGFTGQTDLVPETENSANDSTVPLLSETDSQYLHTISETLSIYFNTDRPKELEENFTFRETLVSSMEILIKNQETLLELNTSIAKNQQELYNSTKIGNTLLVILCIAVMLTAGINLAHAVWSKLT